MKSFLSAIFIGALLCAVAVAQDSTPPPSSSPQQSPTTQAPSNEQSAQPSPSGSQQTPEPATPPSDTAQPQAPSRQAPSGEQAAPPSSSQSQRAPATQPTSPAQSQAPSRQAPSEEQAARPSSAESQANGAKRVAPGSVIPVELTKTIDAKKAKTGDQVEAKVTKDLKSNNGELIFAKDTKVMGHVTEAQPRSKEQKESQVGITFDRAVMKNGSELQVPMSIQAIIGPQNNPNSAGQPAEGMSAAGTGSTSGRSSGMGRSSGQSMPSGSSAPPSDTQSENNARPPITAQTQGVVGISDMKLESAGQAQGSVVSSEKNNVKLDSGTLLLLRVNQ